MSKHESWLIEQGFHVVMLEPWFDPAFIGVVMGGTQHHAAYDQFIMIERLCQRGHSRSDALKLFDSYYYPLSEQPGGPKFIFPTGAVG